MSPRTTKTNFSNRFWSKVSKTGECWLWIGSLNNNGYGQMRINTRSHLAHRLSYELTYGKISKGLVVNHLCEMPNCVNPKHLEAITQLENVHKGRASRSKPHKQRAYCKNGHSMVPENVYIYKNNRACRECRKLRVYAHRAERSD